MIIDKGFLLISCFKLTGFCITLLLIFPISILNLILIAFCSVVVFLITLKTSLKKASPSTVESVLGPQWGAFLPENEKDVPINGLKIIAHRACGLDSPENSICALKNIISKGIKAVEFDVMLTADNVPVVFHDDSLTRMTRSPDVIKNMQWTELEKVDLSEHHPFGKLHANATIPSMDEFVKCCLDNQITMLIDLKDTSLVPHIIEIFKKYPTMKDKALVSSFDPMIIYKIRKADPEIVGCLAWRPYFYTHGEYSENGPKNPYFKNWLINGYRSILNAAHEWILWNFLYHILGLSALLLHKDMITRGVIQHWKNRGIRVLAWTVNSPSEKIFFERVFQIPYLTDTVIVIDR